MIHLPSLPRGKERSYTRFPSLSHVVDALTGRLSQYLARQVSETRIEQYIVVQFTTLVASMLTSGVGKRFYLFILMFFFVHVIQTDTSRWTSYLTNDWNEFSLIAINLICGAVRLIFICIKIFCCFVFIWAKCDVWSSLKTVRQTNMLSIDHFKTVVPVVLMCVCVCVCVFLFYL